MFALRFFQGSFVVSVEPSHLTRKISVDTFLMSPVHEIIRPTKYSKWSRLATSVGSLCSGSYLNAFSCDVVHFVFACHKV